MAPGFHISIRTKILLVLSLVLIAAVGLYLYLASRLFYEDKTLLVYELNQTKVRTLGEETDTYIRRLLDRMKVLAILQNQAGPAVLGVNVPGPVFDLLRTEDDGILRIGVLSRDSLGVIQDRTLGEWTKSLAVGAQGASLLGSIRARYPIPFNEMTKRDIWVKNVTLPSEAEAEIVPIMTIAASTAGGTQVIYGDIRLDHLLNAVSGGGIAKAYLIDSDGFMLAHPDSKQVIPSEALTKDSLVQAALVSKVRSEVKQFESEGKSYLGSFYRLPTGGIIVASRVETNAAFAAARVLVNKSLLYALLVITAAFLVALFLSHSLTVPIERMVDATRRIAQGDFQANVPVSTHDELAILATSFNAMTEDLASSRRKIEDALERLKSTQQQLVHSERMAAIGQVARSIGHEFGNILMAIMGNADLAMATSDQVKIRGSLQTIVQAVDRASLIVRNLQSFSKTHSARTPTEPSALIKATLSLTHHETKKHSIEVIEACDPCRSVVVNPAEIEQVLLNLLINAVHAMSSGGRIDVGCRDRGNDVVIWVRDTGSGITPEVLPKIFDFAFTTKGDKGSGLGLAISRQIIENHQGRIDVETIPGKGTTFYISLPGEKVI